MQIQKLVVVAGLMLAGTVHAADHIMRVQEVLLNGGNNEQFVELHDTSPEGLPFGPYELVIYNSAGTMTESVTLTGITAGASVYYTVGNAAAAATYNTVTFGATLTMALPNPGQACFERGAGTKLHCMAWGCNTSLAIAGTLNSAVPTSGMSLSTNSSVIQFASPTPVAANSSGTAAGTACTPPMVDAGVTPDSGGGGGGADAGTDPGGDDDNGCCQSTTTPARSLGAGLMSLLVLGLVLRRRRR